MHLEASGSISGGFWRHLGASGGHLETSGSIWEASRGTWEHLGGNCEATRHLETSGNFFLEECAKTVMSHNVLARDRASRVDDCHQTILFTTTLRGRGPRATTGNIPLIPEEQATEPLQCEHSLGNQSDVAYLVNCIIKGLFGPCVQPATLTPPHTASG